MKILSIGTKSILKNNTVKYFNKQNYINKILYLTKGHHISIFLISLLFIVSSLFDIISLSSIGVYASFIFSDDQINHLFFKYLSDDLIHLFKQNNFLLLNILIIVLFLIKFIFVILIQNIILKFSYDRQTEIRKKLVDSFIVLIPYSDFILKIHLNT